QPMLGLSLAEIAGPLVPEARLGRIATHTAQNALVKGGWIEGCAHSQRRPPVAGIGGALIEKARRGDVTRAKECVAARQKLRDFLSRETRARCRRRRGSWGIGRRGHRQVLPTRQRRL